jgi:hypothetical protein
MSLCVDLAHYGRATIASEGLVLFPFHALRPWTALAGAVGAVVLPAAGWMNGRRHREDVRNSDSGPLTMPGPPLGSLP